MMEREKHYMAISVIIGLVLLYSIGVYCYYAFANGFYFSPGNMISNIPSLLGMGGVIIFYSSGFKRSGLLRWFMCFEIFSFPFTAWYFVYYFTKPSAYISSVSKLNIAIIVSIFLTLVITACCCIGLWLLSKEQSPKISYIQDVEEVIAQFEPANAGSRFTNRLIDTIVMLFIVIRHLSIYQIFDGSFRADGYLGFLIIEIPAIIIYYLLLEGIFNTTAGKCATNTIIVNENGNRPNFGQIAGRTFCRLIPFDALSFLGNAGRGWHDSITGTYVTAAMHKNDLATNEITFDAELNQEEI